MSPSNDSRPVVRLATKEDDNTEGDDERMSVSEGEEEDVGNADEDVGLDDEYLPEGYSEGSLTITPDLSWLHDATKYDFYGAAAKLYKFPSEFELYFPEEDDVIIRPHDGCVGIYPYHFEFGLCFPLDRHLKDLVVGFNVFQAQLTPLVICQMVCYI